MKILKNLELFLRLQQHQKIIQIRTRIQNYLVMVVDSELKRKINKTCIKLKIFMFILLKIVRKMIFYLRIRSESSLTI